MYRRKNPTLNNTEPEQITRLWGNEKAKYSALQKEVQVAISQTNWFDRWGADCLVFFFGYFGVVPIGLILLQSTNTLLFALGLGCLGFVHHLSMGKLGHMAVHGFFRQFSEKLNRFLCWFSIELIGAFPTEIGRDGHSKMHHPHTNVIGLGDSSTWKFPAVSCIVYMFFLPLLFPILTPLAGVFLLMKDRKFLRTMTFVFSVFSGFAIQLVLIQRISGLEPICSLLCSFASRAIFMVPFVHVNIFGHIGLCMYSPENRPDRLTQMTHGALNLSRHPILDWNFGHSVLNSHVEHHLFPTLSDNMCLNIKPIVKRFLEKNELSYFEKTYTNRLMLFINKYQELMVNAPPITEFIAVQ